MQPRGKFYRTSLKNLYNYHVDSSNFLVLTRQSDFANRDEYTNTRILANKAINCAYNWMSPEVLNGEYPTEMSDMYGFCAVIWEIFNGK